MNRTVIIAFLAAITLMTSYAGSTTKFHCNMTLMGIRCTFERIVA